MDRFAFSFPIPAFLPAFTPALATVSETEGPVSTLPATAPPTVPANTNSKAVPELVADDKQTEGSQSSLKIVGNKNSKIFQQPWCAGYDRVSEKNRVNFNSAAEAEVAGYRIAKNCSVTNPN